MAAAISASGRPSVVRKRPVALKRQLTKPPAASSSAAATAPASQPAAPQSLAKSRAAPTKRRPAPRTAKTASEPAVRLRRATATDHAAIEELLSAVGPAAVRSALAASLDHPSYEPGQRLLVERGASVLAHVHLLPRTMQLGAAQVPAGVLSQLATLPEPFSQTYDAALVRAAGRVMVERKLPVALLATREPRRYEAFGWTVCPGAAAVQTSSRRLLSRLALAGLGAENCPFNIRPWRQVELPALIHLHALNTAGCAGTLVRNEQDWRWLVASGLFDRIYVALASDAPGGSDAREPCVAGYAVIRDDRILELMELPGHAQVAEHLLARVAGESIERDNHALRLHSPHAPRMQALFADGPPQQHTAGNQAASHQAAGNQAAGNHATGGRQLLARITDPALLLRQLEGELLERASRAALSLPCELGLDVSPIKLHVRLSRRRLQLKPGKLGRSYLRTDQSTLARLLLGMADAGQAVESGKLFASTRLALETAQVLFPPLGFWSSPWDNADG